MNKIWITREIVFHGIVNQHDWDIRMKLDIIPFVLALVEDDRVINWYTSLRGNKLGCPNFRIYIRVESEHYRKYIENLFSDWIAPYESNGELSFLDTNPTPPTDFSDEAITSIQWGSYSALELLYNFPMIEDRKGDKWSVYLLRELLMPIHMFDGLRLHFLIVNIGGSEEFYLKWVEAMLVNIKIRTNICRQKWGKFGRLIRRIQILWLTLSNTFSKRKKK